MVVVRRAGQIFLAGPFLSTILNGLRPIYIIIYLLYNTEWPTANSRSMVSTYLQLLFYF